MAFILFEGSVFLFFAVLAVDLWFKGRWYLPYFRFGLPLAVFEITDPGKRSFDRDELTVFFNQNDQASPILFGPERGNVLLYKSLFFHRGHSFSIGLTPLFHGTLEKSGGKVLLTARHNPVLLAGALAVFSFLFYLLHTLVLSAGNREAEPIAAIAGVAGFFALFAVITWHRERDRLGESFRQLSRYLNGEIEVPRPGGP